MKRQAPKRCEWPGCHADDRSHVVGGLCWRHQPTVCVCERPDPSGIGECRTCHRLVAA